MTASRRAATAALGCAVGGALALVLGTGGCAEDCSEGYEICTTIAGLRMAECGTVYLFNNGARISERQKALNYCYCSYEKRACTDGRTLTVCDATPTGGASDARFSDGSIADIASGMAECLGFTMCELETNVCFPPAYLIHCVADVHVWFSSSGQVYNTREAALADCNVDRAARDGMVGICVPAVDTCEDVAECEVSSACVERCGQEPACERLDAKACDLDPACSWVA